MDEKKVETGLSDASASITSVDNSSGLPSNEPEIVMPESISDKPLWAAIAAHVFDHEEHELTFSKRLARENAWTPAFALHAIEEYRKFIYLVCVSPKTLTPSDEVDQVWHLHVTYTRDYWDVFCKNVIKRPLHHGPTQGGDEESKKYEECYQNTLSLYSTELGTEPRIDMWPDVKTRFKNVDEFIRYNVKNEKQIEIGNQSPRFVFIYYVLYF